MHRRRATGNFAWRWLVIRVPVLLTGLRAALAPVVVVLAIWWPQRAAFAACLTLAFVSDVFDGIIARRLGVATPTLRRLDSLADTAFYLAATFAAWRLYPGFINAHLIALGVLALLEALRYVVDLAKFGREASYHMWSSKLWGLALFFAFLTLLGTGQTGPWVALPIFVGIVADLEGLAISFVLTEWRADVPSLLHALRSRRQRRL